MADFRPSFSDLAAEFIVLLPKRRQRVVMDRAYQLARHPFLESDYRLLEMNNCDYSRMKMISIRLVVAFAALVAMISVGCSSYPQGITKAEWDHMTPGERASIRAQEKRRIRAIEQSYTKDGRVFSDAINDDQRNREKAPELEGR